MPKQNPLLNSVSQWFARNFSDPGAVSLFFTLVFGLLIIEFFGNLLLPVLISVVIAYLLYSFVKLLTRLKIPYFIAVLITFLLFIGIIIFGLVGLMPMLWKQASNLVTELPESIVKGQHWIVGLQQHYPRLLSDVHVQHVINLLRQQTSNVGRLVVRYSLATIPSLITVILYFILVPLLVFFFLKDAEKITHWFAQYMPHDRGLVLNVWREVNTKIAAYVRGRVLEIIIVGTVSSIAFELLGLQYSVLLGAAVGLSVIIPYVGATIVTIPVVIIGLMEWGLSAHFIYLMVVYFLIIALDANLLVPLLFSEAMNLHPVVIILAVVIFGGIWGFWGVFFAIPLATLVDAVMRAWPRAQLQENPE